MSAYELACIPPRRWIRSAEHDAILDQRFLEDGKLKGGVYRIQNIYTESFLDTEIHSKSVCCRPAKDLVEERGLVRWDILPAVHASDRQKWEIKSLGAGYTVQVVSVPVLFDAIFPSHAEEH